MWEETREDSLRVVWFAWLAAAAMLVCFFVMARLGFSAKTAGFDEIRQIGAGWAHRKAPAGRFQSEEPPLGEFLLALPVRAEFGPALESLPGWAEGDSAALGAELLSGALGRLRLYSARWVSLLFAAVLALGVFRWSLQLWGPFGGVFSLGLFIFSPAMLGFGSLATVDMLTATFGFYAVYGFWRAYHRQSILRIVFVAFAAAAAAGSRHAGAGIYVLLAAFCLMGIFFGESFYPLSGPGEEAEPRDLWFRLIWNYAGVLALCVAGGWAGLSALGGFDFSIGWYLNGLRDLVWPPGGGESIFYNGSYRTEGFPSASFLALWFKTPPGVLFSALLGLACVRRGRFYDAAHLVVAGGLAFLGATTIGRTGHVDELVLIYPMLYVLAGAVFQPPLLPHAPQVLAAGAGLIWVIGNAFALAPNYFAYANFLAGGPAGAARRFDAGDRDRGRDVPALRQSLSKEPDSVATVYLPSLAQPQELRGATVRDLAKHPEEIFFPGPGLYAVGLRDLQRLGFLGIQGFRFHWLQDYKAQRVLGSGLCLFRFESAEHPPWGYDPATGANRIGVEELWEGNRARLEALRIAATGGTALKQARAAGAFIEGMALLNAGDYESAAERLLQERKAGVRSKGAEMCLAIGLAQAYRALGRTEALKEEIAAIRAIDPANAVAAKLEPAKHDEGGGP